MEKKIREYEKFIEKEVKSGNRSEELWRLHAEMVKSFQHERLVHLLIMLFFVGVTIVAIFIFMRALILGISAPMEFFVADGIMTLLLVGITAAYVKHYYFLENHIQGLYKYFYEFKKK